MLNKRNKTTATVKTKTMIPCTQFHTKFGMGFNGVFHLTDGNGIYQSPAWKSFSLFTGNWLNIPSYVMQVENCENWIDIMYANSEGNEIVSLWIADCGVHNMVELCNIVGHICFNWMPFAFEPCNGPCFQMKIGIVGLHVLH